jgi:multidrug transporter EmrE-like cation transporter
MSPAFPFWLGSGLVILAALLVFIFIKEPKDLKTSADAPVNTVAGFFEFLSQRMATLLVGLLIAIAVGAALTLLIPAARSIGSEIGIPAYVGVGVVLLLIWFIGFYAYYMAREPIRDRDKSALRLFLAIFAWFIGYNAIEAFLRCMPSTSWGWRHPTVPACWDICPCSLYFLPWWPGSSAREQAAAALS